MKKLKYGVKGMSGAACVAHVEASAAKICPKECVSVSLLTNSITVTVEESTDEKALFSELKKALNEYATSCSSSVNLPMCASSFPAVPT